MIAFKNINVMPLAKNADIKDKTCDQNNGK
jgi:hypothetical protein